MQSLWKTSKTYCGQNIDKLMVNILAKAFWQQWYDTEQKETSKKGFTQSSFFSVLRSPPGPALPHWDRGRVLLQHPPSSLLFPHLFLCRCSATKCWLEGRSPIHKHYHSLFRHLLQRMYWVQITSILIIWVIRKDNESAFPSPLSRLRAANPTSAGLPFQNQYHGLDVWLFISAAPYNQWLVIKFTQIKPKARKIIMSSWPKQWEYCIVLTPFVTSDSGRQQCPHIVLSEKSEH